MKRLNILIVTIIAVLAASCGKKTDSRQVLMVSILPQKYALEQIVGDKWDVACMLEKATSAESYDPEMSQMKKLETCRAYFLIGNLGFEQTVKGRLEGDAGKMLVDSSEGIDLIMEHAHGADAEADPHVWMSVRNMRIIARNMYRAVVAISPADSAAFRKNYEKFDASLAALDASLAAQLQPAVGTTFVVWHPALSYFARDYRLRQMGIEHEGKETSLAHVGEVLASASAAGAKVYFRQEGADERQAETVCSRIDLRRVEINPLSYEWKKQMQTIANGLTE